MLRMFLHLLNIVFKKFITKMIQILSKGSFILNKQYSITLKTAKHLLFVSVNYISEHFFERSLFQIIANIKLRLN